jgi:2-polyprenyl-6-methoxyphenol hydroxylase-like FAD-dependent oxidoreductase
MGQGGAMALEDAIVLADMLAEAGNDLPSLLTAFSERRFERCKYVQDQSRRVGEAGATEDKDAIIVRNQQMQANAQRDVDRFYARMAEPL